MTLAPRWWKKETDGEDSVASCNLCIHACTIAAGKWGYCRARAYDGTFLVSPYLGRFSSVAVDPIEKKPLYHWRPGTFILSLGSLGCTMRCPFCQNHSIAQAGPQGHERPLTAISPETLLTKSRELGLSSVAYTYNEPALQAEYIINAAPLLHEAGIATVLVSNGMYSEALLNDITPHVDAANIDLKTFTPQTYNKLGGSLETVKRSIRHFHEQGVHVEVTTLVVPGVSDDPASFAEEVDWLASVSPEIPLHISRYRPAHKFTAPPTDISLLQRFASLAQTRLNHVHIGNVPGLRVQIDTHKTH